MIPFQHVGLILPTPVNAATQNQAAACGGYVGSIC
jgi:hypothetical protein